MAFGLGRKFAELQQKTTKTIPSQPEGNHQLMKLWKLLLWL